MPTRPRGSRFGLALTAAVVAVVVAVGIAMYHNIGPVTARQECTAEVGGQHVDLSLEQGRNATLIAAIGVSRGLPARAVSIALATAYQESKLRNLDHGDRDSLGLFQQRPSQGWGTVAQVRDPYYATNKFYEALEKIDGYETMRITEAAQRVQRSGYPEAYQPHAADARALASALTGYSPGGRFSCVIRGDDARSTRASVVSDLQRGFGELQVERGVRQDFSVVVGSGSDGQRRGWSVAQYLVAHASTLRVRAVSFDGRRWEVGNRSRDGWQPLESSTGRVTVSLG